MGCWKKVFFWSELGNLTCFSIREEEAKDAEGDDEERKEDFSELKNALSGLKLGGGSLGAKPQAKDESVDTKIPADTPLNTQIV